MEKRRLTYIIFLCLFLIPLAVFASSPPSVTLVIPDDNFRDNNGNQPFLCNATDDEKLVNISLYHNISGNVTLNQTMNVSGMFNESSFSVLTIPNGTYLWNCQAFDNESQQGWSPVNYTFTIGAQPEVVLDSPPPEISDSTRNISFNCSATDTYSLMNISLFHNISGTWMLNQTTSISGTFNSTVFTLSDIPDGNYIWNCLAFDNKSQYDWCYNRSFREGVDYDYPIISGVSPANLSSDNDGLVLFAFNVSDESSGIANCSLYINQIFNTSLKYVSEHSSNAFGVMGLTNGNYYWAIECTDLSTEANKGYSAVNVVSVSDLTAPDLYIDTPENDTTDLNGEVIFSYYINEWGYGTDNCSLFIDGVINQTNSTINESFENKFNMNRLTNDEFSWNIQCFDKIGNTNSTETRALSVNIEQIGPNVTLISPNATDTDGNITFEYTTFDLNFSISHCDLYINNAYNQSNDNVTESSVETFNVILPEDNYDWYVNCFDDTVYETRTKSDTWNFSVDYDTTAPRLDLVYPDDRATITTIKIVSFAFSVSDDSGISNCSLIINGTINSTGYNITNGATNYINSSPLYNGEYMWGVNCTDASDTPNTAQSPPRVLFMNTQPNVTLVTPDNMMFSDGTFNISFMVNDDEVLRNCTLFHNMSSARGFGSNLTNTFVQRNTTLDFLIKDVPDDTSFFWNILCFDKDYYTSWAGENRTAIINNTPPTLTDNIPTQSWNEDRYTSFNISPYFSDRDNDTIGYTSTLPEHINKTVIDNSTGMVYIYPEKNWFGSTNVTFTAHDDLENQSSNSVTLNIQEMGDTAPYVFYQYPANNSVDSDGYIFPECSVSDDYSVVNISLFTNASGTWGLSQTRQTFGDVEAYTFNMTNLTDSTYMWNCLAWDDNGNYSWGENRIVDVEIMANISTDIPAVMVNNVNISSYVIISYGSYLNNTLTLGNLTIYESDGEVYYNENISNSSNFESSLMNIHPILIDIIPDEIFDGNFTVGNSEMLNLTFDYYYQGKNYNAFTNVTIEIKECTWCD